MTFPTGDSKEDKSARLNAASVTLQNLNGRAVVSTTFPPQQKAIGAGTDVVSSQSNLAPNQPAPAHAKVNGTGVLDAATIRSLAPALGFNLGSILTSTKLLYRRMFLYFLQLHGWMAWTDIIPPALQSLLKSVQAWIAVNNPSVKVTFPTDNSNQSQSTWINAALITLQNLNGPGKWCPAVSTTLLARQKALAA